MAHETFTGVSGTGTLTLASPQLLEGVEVVITTDGLGVQYRDVGDPARVMHAGWWAIGYLLSGELIVEHWSFLTWRRADYYFGPGGDHSYSDYVFYSFPPGQVCDVTAYW